MSTLPQIKSVKSPLFNQTDSFTRVDNALSEYCNKLGVTNYNHHFMEYIYTEKLNDPDLPIENELGDNCSPNDCAYTWMNNDTPFPIPSYLVMPDEEKETFMFYILQYCWKYNHCPTDEYIRTYLAPKITGCVVVEDLILSLEQVSGHVEKSNDEHTESSDSSSGFDDDFYTDNKDDFVMVLDPFIESQLEYSINVWNLNLTSKGRCYINFQEVKKLFFVYNINHSYFQSNKRKEFRNLLKNKLGIPKAASTKIWKDFQMFVFMDYNAEMDYEADTSFIIDLQENQYLDF